MTWEEHNRQQKLENGELYVTPLACPTDWQTERERVLALQEENVHLREENTRLKEKLAGEEVAFVYITNQSSPEETWNLMIPDIDGEHYRVETDQWNLMSSRFNISGIPHYLLVDKEGQVADDKIHYAYDVARLEQLISQYLNK